MQHDLKPIRVFLEVAKRRSFTSAAKALQMTPASITRIVARLEEEFEQQLLIRTTRQVSLSSAGARVAQRYQPLVDAFDQAKRDLDREMQPFKGRLSINAPMSFGQHLMPGLIESFRLAYPSIELTIRLTDRLVDIVSEECDLAIRVSTPPTGKSPIWRKLCEVPLCAVAAPSLFDRVARPKTPREIDPVLCLSYGEGNEPEVWRFQQGERQQSVTTAGTLHSNNGDLLYGLARNGSGIVVLPEFHVAAGLQRGDVVKVVQDWSLSPLWLSLYYPPYETLPPLVATFSDFFEAYLSGESGFRM